MKEKKEIKVKVTYSEGYEQRFTAALLKQIARAEVSCIKGDKP